MDANNTNLEALESKMKSPHVGVAEATVEAIVGAAAGATTGILAGPPGIIAGAVIGGAIGAAVAEALHQDQVEQEMKQEKLDRDIGVIGGNLGEAPPDAPRSERGLFHTETMGAGGERASTPSEGPIQSVDE